MDFFQGETVHCGWAEGTQRFPTRRGTPLQLFLGIGIVRYSAAGLVRISRFLGQHKHSVVGSPFQGAIFEHIAVQIPDFIPVITVGIPQNILDLHNSIPDKHADEQITCDPVGCVGLIHIGKDPGVFRDLYEITGLMRGKLFGLPFFRLFSQFFGRFFHRFLGGFLDRFLNRGFNRFIRGFFHWFLRRLFGRFFNRFIQGNPCQHRGEILRNLGRFFCRFLNGFVSRIFHGFFYGVFRFIRLFGIIVRNVLVSRIGILNGIGFVFNGFFLVLIGRDILIRFIFRCSGEQDLSFVFHDDGKLVITFQCAFRFLAGLGQ